MVKNQSFLKYRAEYESKAKGDCKNQHQVRETQNYEENNTGIQLTIRSTSGEPKLLKWMLISRQSTSKSHRICLLLV